MFFKILMLGVVLGVGAYYYDQSSAVKTIKDARFSSSETENRCRQNHETMCQYYMTVKLEQPEKLFYKFRVPSALYKRPPEELKERRFRVLYKEKKIFPASIVGLEPKFQAEIDKAVSEEK